MLRNSILKICSLTGLFICLISLSAFSDEEILFRWAFVKNNSMHQDQMLDFSSIPVVKSGDEMRIVLEPLSNAYIYLYLYDSSKNLSVIFPDNFSQFDSKDYNGNVYYIPDQGWFSLVDPTGKEHFYMLASSLRQERLEQLTLAYKLNPNAETRAAVLSEIKSLRKKHSKLTAEAEVGLSIAGTIKTFRGPGQNASTADTIKPTEVRAKRFYGKTIRLKHE